MTDFTEGLNAFQKEAVTYGEGPMLILAGAGSGKTRVMTHRIAWLMQEKRVPAFRILAVTFTNKAARELRERVESLAGEEGKEVWAMTFHSLCVRILRKHIDRLEGYTRSFVIYDSADQQTLIKDCLKELNIDPKIYVPKAVRATIGTIKDDMLSPEEYIESAGADYHKKTVGRIFELYQKKLQQMNALDFDDLILKTLELFVMCPDVLNEYRHRFLYVLVDEYQDTNEAQFQLVRLLSSRYHNICVVGDDDQSIYAFRGAKIKNILDFEKEFPGAHRIKLEENYRSTANILNAANSVIANNEHRKEKTLRTSKGGGDYVHVVELDDERREADYISREISKRLKTGRKPSDFAVLYRTNAISRAIEESLMGASIPYSVYGGLRFYDRAEVKDIVAYLRLIVNPSDDISLRRVINMPRRGIGDKTLEDLQNIASQSGVSMMAAIDGCEEGGIKAAAASKLHDFAKLIKDMTETIEGMGLGDAVLKVIEKSGYGEMLSLSSSIEDETRKENIDELASAAGQYSADNPGATVADFLENIALVSDVDKLEEESGTVALMTVHSSKGLEFPVVFVAAMEEGVFPHQLSIDEDETALEEERRLCYVAITRAEKELFLTHVGTRRSRAYTERKIPSRFLDELDKRVIKEETYAARFGGFDTYQERPQRRTSDYSRVTFEDIPFFAGDDDFMEMPKPKKRMGTGVNSFGDFDPDFSRVTGTASPKPAKPASGGGKMTVGVKVKHPKFGTGTVVAIEGQGDDKVLSIAFERGGIKKLLASIAPLKVID